MCGEKSTSTISTAQTAGSPPHVRGKDSYHMKGMAADRITPACAGKSAILDFSLLLSRDHPRMCGEKLKRLRKAYKSKGSPPHVRGKGIGFWLRLILFGITPACAGKRCKRYYTQTYKKDHPRMCGEKV